MKSVRPLPPIAFLRECFRYEPETGELFWQKTRPREHFRRDLEWKRFNSTYGGGKVGISIFRDKEKTNPSGIVLPITYAGLKTTFYAHRIVFALMDVDVPEGMYIDHANGCPLDNRWSNLRLATPSQNSCNKKKNTKGRGCDLPKGVSRQKGCYRASVMKNGVSVVVGIFPTPESAHLAYCEAARELHGEFFRCG